VAGLLPPRWRRRPAGLPRHLAHRGRPGRPDDQRHRQAAGHGGDPDHDRVGRPWSPDPRAARPGGASGHPEQPAGDLPQGGPPPAHRAGSPACWWTSSSRTGWCRPRCRPRPTGGSPSGRRR